MTDLRIPSTCNGREKYMQRDREIIKSFERR